MHAGASLEPTDLASQAPTEAQRRGALAALLFFVAVFAALLPFARIQLAPAVGFVAMYGGALVVTDLLTAVLLFGQLPARRSRALAVLALGYLFAALVAAAHFLSFPGLLQPSVFVGDNQLAAWLYLAWHAVFPLFVIGFARAGEAPAGRYFVRKGVLLVCLLALACVVLAARISPMLPQLVEGNVYNHTYRAVVAAMLLLGLLALLAVRRKPKQTVLDLWLTVALAGCLLEIALSVTFSVQRYDLGFYAGRLYGLAASLFVLGVLTVENMSLHTRLRATFEQMIEARAREKSNQLLASVLQQLPEGVVILDGEDKCVLANERASDLARGAAGEPAGDGAAVLALVGDRASRAAGGESFKDEILERAGDGERRVFSVSGAPVRDEAGRVAATVVVLDDVTERIKADQRVRHDFAQTRALLENTPLAAIEWGGDQVIRMWSRRAEELFGWSAAEVVGHRIDEIPLVHPEDMGNVSGMLTELLHCGRGSVRSENRNVTRDGRTLQCEWYNSVLYNELGQVDTVFSLALDVTERRQAMEQLRDADRRKDVFIATLAHELRNPLAPIANAASLLLAQQANSERIEWIAAMIGRQSARMARLLDDLLDVTRISRGKIELRRETIELTALVGEALQTSMPLVEAARHHLETELPVGPVWVDADPLRMAQVLSNLVNNAAKYTRPGGLIIVRLTVEKGNAVVSVTDNGIGIEGEMLPHVFDPFVQSGSARDLAQGGLGIGLSLARGLVELHGGTISVHSDGKDRGSVFTVTLPLAAQQALAFDEPCPETAAVLDKTILVADDNADAADSLALLLRARGAQVDVAHDGEEALQMFREYPADIAILDLGMPRLGGLDVARQLARSNPRPYLVAVTGRGRKEDRLDSLKAGFDEHLTKPVEPHQLIELLGRVRHARREPVEEGGRRSR